MAMLAVMCSYVCRHNENAMEGKMTRIDNLNTMLPDGFEFATWSPGDGTTRYRIVRKGEDYFESSAPVALGYAQAEVAARYFVEGMERR